MLNDILKMTERCSDISSLRSLSSLRILVGMPYSPADLLGLKFKSLIFLL